MHLLVEAAVRLESEGVGVRVVSFPSWERFAAESIEYRESVLPPAVTARVAVEAGSPMGWERWVGPQGRIHGIDHYGASAPAGVLATEFGFTVDRVMHLAHEVLSNR